MARSITIHAWTDGGPSTPNATVTLTRSDEHPGLYELAVAHNDGDWSLAGVLVDAGSVEMLMTVIPEPVSEHRIETTGPDIAGHFGWRCLEPGCPEDRSGYDLGADVVASAREHGVLTADSYDRLRGA